jgi:hypothetical protein
VWPSRFCSLKYAGCHGCYLMDFDHRPENDLKSKCEKIRIKRFLLNSPD